MSNDMKRLGLALISLVALYAAVRVRGLTLLPRR